MVTYIHWGFRLLKLSQLEAGKKYSIEITVQGAHGIVIGANGVSTVDWPAPTTASGDLIGEADDKYKFCFKLFLVMKINNMFFIAMCGLFISCGAEITTDISSEVLSDRQIPIGISTVAVPEYGAETTRGLIVTPPSIGSFPVRTLTDIHLSMMLPILTVQPVGPHSQKYWWITVRWGCTHIILISLYHLSITRRLRL